MATAPSGDTPATQPGKQPHPFRRAVLRGLALTAPPLLTLLLFLWAWSLIESNVLIPLENTAEWVVVSASPGVVLQRIPASVEIDDMQVVRDGQEMSVMQFLGRRPEKSRVATEVQRRGGAIRFRHNGEVYVPISNDWLAETVYERVIEDPGPRPLLSATDYYRRYIRITYLQRWRVIPVFLLLLVVMLYLAGKFLAAGAGRMLWNFGEAIIHRLPIIRNVYSSVKQVTDFFLTEQEVAFMRVVAVEYPRKGIWTVAFVTGESMLDIRSAANEPVVTLLIPTSPMPATGFTITVRKSETIDLGISVDQAIQFIVSCGVVVPPPQLYSAANYPAAPLPSSNGGAPPGRSGEQRSLAGPDDEAADAKS